MQIEIITLLSKYSVDCVATAISVFFILYIIKKKFSPPEKLNQLLPFCLSFAVYCVLAAMGKLPFNETVSKSFTAGGLATVLYAFAGGFSSTSEEELKELMKSLLKNVVKDDNVSVVTQSILNDFKSKAYSGELKTIRISDLIKSNLKEGASSKDVDFICSVFIKAYEKLKTQKNKNKTPE